MFARQFHKLDKQKDLGQEFVSDSVSNDESSGKDFETSMPSTPQNIYVYNDHIDDPVKAGIHKENQDKLNTMSQHEILEEQNKLMGSLGMLCMLLNVVINIMIFSMFY